MSPKNTAEQGSLGIAEFSVLMQVRAAILNDLARHIPTDYYASRAITSNLAIFESENLDRIRHLARLDFQLAKELTAENDRSPTFTPRDVSATEVLNAVGYYLMFLGLEENQRTPHRLDRTRAAKSQLQSALRLYVLYLSEDEARPMLSALAATSETPTTSSTPALAAIAPLPTVGLEEEIIDPGDDWKMQCQIEAYAQWIRLRATGANPSVRGMSEHVSKWCKENDVRTSGSDKYPSSTYLKTHVLGGKHWQPPLNMSVQAAKAKVAQKNSGTSSNGTSGTLN